MGLLDTILRLPTVIYQKVTAVQQFRLGKEFPALAAPNVTYLNDTSGNYFTGTQVDYAYVWYDPDTGYASDLSDGQSSIDFSSTGDGVAVFDSFPSRKRFGSYKLHLVQYDESYVGSWRIVADLSAVSTFTDDNNGSFIADWSGLTAPTPQTVTPGGLLQQLNGYTPSNGVINLNYTDVGAASSSHTHSFGQITGTLAISQTNGTAAATGSTFMTRTSTGGTSVGTGGLVSSGTVTTVGLSVSGGSSLAGVTASGALTVAGGITSTSTTAATHGIKLAGADAPLITNGFDTFSSGTFSGYGRWGVFMAPSALGIGYPAGNGAVKILGYAADSSISKTLATFNDDGALDVLGSVRLGTSGSFYRAVNEDSLHVKYANWYTSNSDQFGQGQISNELWFGAINSNGARRIGFYLNAPGATSGATNADMYITTAGVNIRHLVGLSSAPTIAAGTGAGTSPTISISGTDLSGEITLTTGSSPSASAIVATVTFNVAYGAAPRLCLTPSGANAAALSGNAQVYVTSTTTTFVITVGSSGLTATTQYKWMFVVAQ